MRFPKDGISIMALMEPDGFGTDNLHCQISVGRITAALKLWESGERKAFLR